MIDYETKEQILNAVRERKLGYRAAINILHQLQLIAKLKREAV